LLDNQPIAADTSCPDVFRWERPEILRMIHDYADAASQRQYADQLGVPHATLNYWLRHYSATNDDPVDSFFLSPDGDLLLRRIVCSALVTFSLRGACGIRLVADFLRLAGLDRFVACSRGALHPLLVHLESDLAAFAEQHQPILAQQMPCKTITVSTDEHFHEQDNCLVAIEPVSNFILVECYRGHRDANTWTQAIKDGTKGMHVQIVLLTSDLARGLLCCAEKGLEVMHSPDLFHGQRDLLKPILLPLSRPIQQAQKDLQKAQELRAKLDVLSDQPQPEEELLALIEAVRQEMNIEDRLQQATATKEAAIEEVRGIGDDYHPFDRETGKGCTAEEVGKRLNGHIDFLEKVAAKAQLSQKAQEAVNKSRQWVTTLMGCVAWFWGLVGERLDELELTEEQEEMVKNKLLSGYYWEMAAGRARTAEEKQRLQELAQQLLKEARQDATWSSLPEETKNRLEKVAKETAGLFARSSSSVEGRNGRLSLLHHGHSRVSPRRLKAMTVIHNYVVKRDDGTTAAERFFEQKHPDVCSWLLQRLPDLPRPAQKRRKNAA
jgi:hypothetical protein